MKMPKLYAIQSKQPASRRLLGPHKELIYVDECNVLIESDAHVFDFRELQALQRRFGKAEEQPISGHTLWRVTSTPSNPSNRPRDGCLRFALPRTRSLSSGL